MLLFTFIILSLAHICGASQRISSVVVRPHSVFPVELGHIVTWLFSPVGGAEYDVNSAISFDFNDDRVFRVQKDKCGGPMEQYFSCLHKPNNEISVTFTPNVSHYGVMLRIYYFKDLDEIWLSKASPIYSEIIQLTKQPTFVEMKMHLKEPSRYINEVPTGLVLDPPVFLTGSNVRIDCSTDGALPPAPITFSIECPPPPIAVVEHDRVTQAKQNLAYEMFYTTYGFRSPPTLTDLAPYVARKHADQLLRLGHVSTSKDNLTLKARLSITEKANDCHVVCRLGGKETRRRLTVFYPTTISYLLPRPRDGFVYVGSEITCYADGHPPPMLSLRLTQPLRPPNPLTEEEIDALRRGGRLPNLIDDDPIVRELTLTNSGLDIMPQQIAPQSTERSSSSSAVASSGTLHQLPIDSIDNWFNGNAKEPYEQSDRVPGLGLSTMERHRQLGLRSNEYTISGSKFTLAPNATPGVELVLSCTARNVLPGGTTFLGMNGTITRTRFVIAGLNPTSWAVALGVCACVLFVLLLIIAVMLLQKRHQTQMMIRNVPPTQANGSKRTKNYSKDVLVKRPEVKSNKPVNSHLLSAPKTNLANNYANSQSPTRSVAGMSNNIYRNDPDYQYDPLYPTVDTANSQQMYNMMMMQQRQQNSNAQTPQANASDVNDQLQYAQLSFDHVRLMQQQQQQQQSANMIGPHSGGTTRSLQGVGAGGMYSSSTTTLCSGRGAQQQQQTQSLRTPSKHKFVASVPQGLHMTSDHRTRSVDAGPIGHQSDQVAGSNYLLDESSHYTEIVGYMQPKAYASQLVLQQQQEATQALLAMQQNKPRVFV